MNYSREIWKKIELVNNVLDDIGAAQLFENSSFSIDHMSTETWLKVNMSDKESNKISLSIIFTPYNLCLNLDRVSEAIDWSNDTINKAKMNVMLILKNILVSYILVEYYGMNRTQIRLFNQEGKCTNYFNYREGFPFFNKSKYKLYFPVYCQNPNSALLDNQFL